VIGSRIAIVAEVLLTTQPFGGARCVAFEAVYKHHSSTIRQNTLALVTDRVFGGK